MNVLTVYLWALAALYGSLVLGVWLIETFLR